VGPSDWRLPVQPEFVVVAGLLAGILYYQWQLDGRLETLEGVADDERKRAMANLEDDIEEN
jgi:hypothetical protein